MTYSKKAEKFIKEIESHKDFKIDWINHKDFMAVSKIIKSFAEWLDDQEKSEGKKKIEVEKEIEIIEKEQSDVLLRNHQQDIVELLKLLIRVIKSHNENL